jgi:hypothetical protein
MTFTFTQIKERCRTQCDAAMRLKLSLTEGFERVVIQRSLDRAYAAIRGGKVTEMEAITTELEAVIARYRQPTKEVA